MTDDRCECGRKVRCPAAGELVDANRSGAPFKIMRTIGSDGRCRLSPVHDGVEGLGILCDGTDGLLGQLHMCGRGA